MMQASRGRIRRFQRDAKGSAAILFGLALIPILLGVGIAIDYGRALIVRERMAEAADSAALAIGSWQGLSQDELKIKAQQFFSANYPSSAIGTPTAVAVSFANHDITVSVSATVPTTFMKLANVSSIDVAASSTATVGMGTLEVALVLDNSGSMEGSKIATLKTAANDLVDLLFDSAKFSAKPDPIRISVVTFANSVNVGNQYKNASWISGSGANAADSMKAFGAPSTTNVLTLFDSLKDKDGKSISWGGCVEARPSPNDVTDNSSPAFAPMFAPDEPDNFTCNSLTACPVYACADGSSSCSTSSSTLIYNGVPSGSSFNYNSYLPDAGDGTTCSNTISLQRGSPAVFNKTGHGLAAGDQVIFSGTLPSGLVNTRRYFVISSGLTANAFRVSATSGGSALNLSGSGSQSVYLANTFTCRNGDANCARNPSSGKSVGQSEETGFASPAVLTNGALCKYGTASSKATAAKITVAGIDGGPNFMCTTKPLLPLTDAKATIKAKINEMEAKGATSVGEGAMWGWRTLSPGAPFTEGRSYNTEENQKVLVLMTDGANTYYPQSHFLKSWYGVYGYVERGRLGTTSTTSATLTKAMDDRTVQACTNMKAAGIIVYTVGFEITGTGAAAALDVLKNCASDKDKYFAPDSEAELLSSFNAIGKDISELRISK